MLRAAALLIAAALLSPCASALSACRAAVLDADTKLTETGGFLASLR